MTSEFMRRVRFQEFIATAARLQRERSAAEATVTRLLALHRDWTDLAQHPDLQTCGAIECLGRMANETYTQEPQRALALAQLGASAAELVPDDSYPAIVRAQFLAHAWKDYGKMLRFLSRNGEAIEAFGLAEEKVRPFPVLAHERAIVRFNLALSLQELERFAESQEMLAECRGVFHDHGDMRNAVLCGFAEGVLLQRQGNYREAREIYLLLLAADRDIDKETRAALHQTIGLCSIELQSFADAEANLQQAITLYRELRLPVIVLKAELGRGRLFLRRGEAYHAVAHLRPVRREFLRHGMREEAGLCGLEIVEGLLHIGRASAAESLAKKIVREFTLAELSGRAITALTYLAESIAARSAAPSLVTRVHDYILSLRWTPEREFEP